MTSTPSQILELLGRLAEQSDLVDTPAALRVCAAFSDSETLAAWQDLQSDPGPLLRQIAITVDGSDVPLESHDQYVPGRRYRFTLLKNVSDEAVHLFFSNGVSGAFLASSAGKRVLVADLPTDQAFSARGLAVSRWISETTISPFDPPGEIIDPTRRVFDYAEPRVVPKDLRPWLLSDSPKASGTPFEIWKSEASHRLFSSLVDQVAGTSDDLRYRISGPPVLDFSPSRVEIADAFRPLHTAAEWVFIEGTDQDTRHLLFGIELAHTIRASQSALNDAVPLSLENAKAAYRAHLQSANRETLKALADLRRAVIDETQKTVQRTHDLTGALWRDLLVAAAPFVLKILPDSAKLASEATASIFLVIAAIYLIGSFGTLTVVNKEYFREQERARASWQEGLLRYLPITEIRDISDRPVKVAKIVYDRVHIGVGLFYLVLVAALIGAALAR